MRLHTLLFTAFLFGSLAAQVPQAFDFQAVARDPGGNVLSAQAVSVRLTVHGGTAAGAIAYQEVHAVTTNAFGLFSIAVGQGSSTQGVFADVPWGMAPHFLQVELDAAGGSNYVDMGTTQLLSVPYALHAGGVECASVSLLGDTLKQANGCFVIIPGVSAANGGCLDVDNDGFYNNPGCPPLDCNDADALVNPGATELCGNGTDDDCDGAVDNNTDPLAFVLYYADADGDGFGNAASSVSACAQPMGHVANDDDCDDADGTVFPGQGCFACDAVERAWIDENFQGYRGFVLDAWGACFFEPDQEQCMLDVLATGQFPLSAECHSCAFEWVDCVQANCLGQCIGQGPAACNACAISSGCTATFIQCLGLTDNDEDGVPSGSDCDESNATIYNGAPELCDGQDNDCDGQIDEGNVCNLCPDDDADGFTTCDGDCDDNNLSINPGAVELCNGIDDDCNSAVDEGGVCGTCLDQDFDGYTTCDGDCDDNNLSINPGAVELCNGIDDDCNGQVDEGDPGGGSQCSTGLPGVCASGVTACQNGVLICVTGMSPSAEVCNDLDDDCDGQVDEGNVCDPCSQPNICTISGQCYANGQTNPGSPCLVCNTAITSTNWSFKPAGSSCGTGNGCMISTCNGAGTCVQTFSPAGTPCSDGNPNTVNDICNGTGFCTGTPCPDNDADGFTTCQGDCNDSNANIRPGATEVCNGIDDDCDGQVDEGGVCPE